MRTGGETEQVWGQLVEQVIHMVDLMRYLMGDRSVSMCQEIFPP
jgi:hypothetical protein